MQACRMALTAVWFAVCLTQVGCSILSPVPTWELLKATGTLSSTAIQSQPGEASNTVYHAHAPFKELCIEFNPQAQMADVVPALQTALLQHHIESRVYENLAVSNKCDVWLKYSALIEWDTQSFSDTYVPYISSAALTLQSSSGLILASSNYVLDTTIGRSKWASTRDKLGPVVTALITGL